MSQSVPSRAAAWRTSAASMFTPSDVFPVCSTAISRAASSIRKWWRSSMPVVPMTMALPAAMHASRFSSSAAGLEKSTRTSLIAANAATSPPWSTPPDITAPASDIAKAIACPMRPLLPIIPILVIYACLYSGNGLNRKAGAASASGRRVGICHLKRFPAERFDEINR